MFSLSAVERQQFDSCGNWLTGDQYAVLASQKALNAEQWFRLGQLYAFCDSTSQVSTEPLWFAALQKRRSRADRKNSGKVWDVAFLDSVLNAGAVDYADRPLAIITAFFAFGTKSAKDQPQFEEFLWQQLGLVEAALNNVDLEAKLASLTWLAKAPVEVRVSLAPTLVKYAVNSSKQLREMSLLLIDDLPEPTRSQALAAALNQGTSATSGNVIDRLVRNGEWGRVVLQSALAENRGGKRDELIAAALERSATIAAAPEIELAIPPPPPLDRAPLGDDFIKTLAGIVASRIASLAKNTDKPSDYLKSLQSLGNSDYRAIVDYLNGVSNRRPKALKLIAHQLPANLPLTLIQAARLTVDEGIHKRRIPPYRISQMIDLDHDLRSLAQAAALAKVTNPIDWAAELAFHWGCGVKAFSPANVWPFFAEHPALLDKALGLIPKTDVFDPYYITIDTGLQVLETFPVPPNKYIPRLTELATGESKTHRRRAQRILEKQPQCLAIALQPLSDSKGEIRASAAAWLGRLGDPAAIEPLRLALAKEKREPVQAAMLSALQLLGDDISADLSPEKMLAQATKGLKAGLPAGLSWFPADALPQCHWSDGESVDAAILRWWVVLAYKLKNPSGAGILALYVSQLDQPSQEALGSFILDAWIAHDTEHPSSDECRAYAEAEVDSKYATYQSWAKRYRDDFFAAKAALTKDQVFEELRREKGNEYLASAINDKGILALAVGAPGHHVLQASQNYIRNHGRRRAQVEALVLAASANDDPSAIQFVLSVARKFKQETVRVKAAELSQDIAERRGWSLDELADRTIPTAGFDEDGALILDFGPRFFVGRVSRSPKTGAFTIDLFTAEGKAIKALPKPGMADDDELAKEARKQLSTSKKELSQVAKLQESRLFEAMCVGRAWNNSSWLEYVAQHPIMRHLVATLVWKTWDTAQSEYRILRPTPEGELLDVDDDEVLLSPTGMIGLAHLATITPAETALWRQHLVDYQVTPLFSQFSGNAPAFAKGDTTVSDHQGWLSDSFAIRGRAAKRGYTRGQAEDGGWFGEYFKNLSGSDIRVVVSFTGSFVPEEQISAAVTELSFEHQGKQMLLANVPPILLAESYADYAYIAEAGTFDPDWES
ncbi:MAG: DUF4132 domain-containing protein, partial [Propionibacteriaceae bacterium]|nr:DUF4132 domain-containing protein [Propionibacteriaceae bacterium]